MSRQSMPRSILKCSTAVGGSTAAAAAAHAHHPPCSVRFPSSPKLSTVHFTHCPSSYDRTPIVVSHNSCALPERGCRDYAAEQQQYWGRSIHPSVFGSYRPSDELFTDPGLLPPGLSSDDGSSEESDGIASPPPETIQASSDASHYRTYVPSQSHLHTDPLSHPPIPQYSGPNANTFNPANSTSNATDYSLSFLPHAPAVSTCSSKKSRDKSGKHHREPRLVATATTSSFCSSWGQSEESSCLGGF